jgi:hypothetical protein
MSPMPSARKRSTAIRELCVTKKKSSDFAVRPIDMEAMKRVRRIQACSESSRTLSGHIPLNPVILIDTVLIDVKPVRGI